MRASSKAFVFATLALLALSSVARANEAAEDDVEVGDEPEEEPVGQQQQQQPAGGARRAAPRSASAHPLTNLPPAHPDVRFAHVLPKYDALTVSRGSVIDSLFGIINDADADVTVYSVAGSLNNVQFFEQYLQNFTMIGYNQTIAPEGEGSFLYRYMPSPMLEPGDYQIALTCFYTLNDRVFSTTFFNSTVNLADENSSVVSLGLLVNTVVGLAVAGGVFAFLFWALNRDASAVIAKANLDHVSEEWIPSEGKRRRGGSGKKGTKAE